MEAPITNFHLVLEAKGLSVPIVFAGDFLIAILVVIVLCLKWHGYFQNPTLHNYELQKTTVVYLNKRQKYERNWILYDEIRHDTKEFFKVSNIFAQYHDDPKKYKQPRVTMGILVNTGEIKKIEQFIKKHPGYRIGQLPKTHCKAVSHPYPSPWSSLFVSSKLYPQIRQLQSRKDLQVSQSVMEIYNFISGWPLQKIEILVALQNLQSFNLWAD